MNSFLGEVTKTLYDKYGDDISQLNIIFPSRRARLFFVDALSSLTTKPLWQPQWGSIDEIMSQISGVEVGERIRLISELYKVYSRHHDETFDKFYFWGEILLADFDMIDKYQVDADMLFRNINDIKEIEADISYLTPEQLKIVAFWSSLGQEANLSEEKRRFLKIWRSLAPIYHEFKSRLQGLGLAYTGMVHRLATEKIESGEYTIDTTQKYAIVGFNALSQCEKRLFTELKNIGCAEFFWDWDNYYLTQEEQEAGLFIRENVKLFAESSTISHDNFSYEKSVEVISAASNVLQCKYVSNILEQITASGEKIDKNTAIILTDENLLLPLLYSLPKGIGGVNVTMGYPLRESLPYTFVERLISLQQHQRQRRNGVEFYHADVEGLLSHPYILGLEQTEQLRKRIIKERMIYVSAEFLHQLPALGAIFSPCDNWEALSLYLINTLHLINCNNDEEIELLDAITTHITTLCNSIKLCDIDISLSIYISLLRGHLQTLRVPFEGEPLEGLQVMGILESRSLDFRNVIILSMNDDNFPGNHLSQPSYIPYSLRSAYSLPTPEHHEGVYAYYFYRLLQRAQNIWMLYSSKADDKSTGEASRYIYQLDYESDFTLHRRAVGVDVNLITPKGIEVKKEGRVAEQLARFTRAEEPAALSPTAIYRYIACPLRFYFYSLVGIKDEEELCDGVDASMFGTILHAAMQELYTPLVGVPNFQQALQKQIPNIENCVNRAINLNYLKQKSARCEDYSGNILLIKEIVCKYIRKGIINYDLANPDFIVEGVEKKILHHITLSNGQTIQLQGIADRLDRLKESGGVRIVDYKSGAAHLEFKDLDSLFNGSGKERMSNIIQTLLYSMMLKEGAQGCREAVVTPALYYVRSINKEGYSPYIKNRADAKTILSYEEYHAEFKELLTKTLDELFDPNTPFTQCDAKQAKEICAYCDYNVICKR